jgi:hypothetical protein
MNVMLSEISLRGAGSGDFTRTIFALFIWVLIGLILWGAGKFAFPRFGMPAKGMQIWDGLFGLIALVVVINFLAGLAGHPLFTW